MRFPSVPVPDPRRPPHPSRQHGAPAKGWLSVSPAVFPLWGWEAETCCNTPDEAAPGAFPDGNLAAEPVLGPHPARACKAPRPGEEQACVGVLLLPAQSPPRTPLPGTGGALTLCQMLQGETEARIKPGSVLVSVLPWSRTCHARINSFGSLGFSSARELAGAQLRHCLSLCSCLSSPAQRRCWGSAPRLRDGKGCSVPHRDTAPDTGTVTGHRNMGWPGLRASSAQAPCPNRSGSAKQPEFSNAKKRFLRKFPSSFYGGGVGGGMGCGGGGGGREGSVTLAAGFGPHQHDPGPGEERDAIPTAGREQCGATSPHPGPAGTTQGLFYERMLSLPASQPHTSKVLPAPMAATPARSLLPTAARARAGAGKFSAGRRAPMGSLGATAGGDAAREVPVILKIPKSRYPKGAWRGLAPRPSLSFPSPEPAGALGTDKTLSCSPSKASGSRFLTVHRSGFW